MSECCELMALALDRAYERKGLERAPFINYTKGTTGTAVILHVKRGKKDEPHAAATYARLSFCPFCGKRIGKRHDQRRERRAKG